MLGLRCGLISLFTVALLANRRPFSLRGLGLAAAALMLISPQQVPEVSFQMSFSAVLALISLVAWAWWSRPCAA